VAFGTAISTFGIGNVINTFQDSSCNEAKEAIADTRASKTRTIKQQPKQRGTQFFLARFLRLRGLLLKLPLLGEEEQLEMNNSLWLSSVSILLAGQRSP
jgi:hypothetical protein